MAATLHDARDDAHARETRRWRPARVNAVPRVLVIDDEETKRAQLSSALEVAGFETRGASSADAPHEIANGEFDVAIIDLMLHGTNGFDLARRMRSANPGVRVVLTSAYHFTEVQLARVDCGAVGFVPQPFVIEELTTFLWAKLGA
jgi:DNA-binding response OmpR family regulator